VRRRSNETRGLAFGAARIAGSLSWRLWASATRRPVDSFAVLAAVAASLIIVINAVVLQPGSRPPRFIVDSPAAGAARPNPAEPPPARSADAPPSAQTVAARRNDPIAQLIGMSSRITAVQRVLSDYGYGQLKPSGILDEPTSAAIEKFEREHKLPVTGRLSATLLSNLAAMSGHPLD
jgi:hypothetical protein